MGEAEGQTCYRIGLKTKGCNGMAYTLDFAKPESQKKFEEMVWN